MRFKQINANLMIFVMFCIMSIIFEVLIMLIIVLFNYSFLNGLSNYSAISGMGFKGFIAKLQ